jgi:predicted MFS family arabinose efflux permease
MLVSALLIHTVGAQSIVVLPGFVQGLIEYGGFSEKQAGFIASAETSGMALATVLLTLLVTRVSWRRICAVSLVLLIASNLSSMYVRDFVVFCGLRCVAGIGAGALIALTYAVIGVTSKPDRNFGLCIMLVLIYGAALFGVMPQVYVRGALAGILLIFGGLGVLGLLFVRFMPDSGDQGREQGAPPLNRMSWRQKNMALASVFAFFLANFAVWTYFLRIGIAQGVNEAHASHALALSQFFGIAGAATTATMSARLGRLIPIGFGLLTSMICISFLLEPVTAISFGVISAVYVYVWNMTHPYLLGTMANLDRTGSLVVYGVAMQYLGTTAGPACAAMLIAGGAYRNVIYAGLAAFAGCLMLIVPPVLWHARSSPEEPLRSRAAPDA